MIQENDQHIYPVFERVISRPIKESRLRQRAKVIWLTGLSGSGKTTLASGLESTLFRIGYFTQILDGDNVRSGINTNLGFSEKDRIENIRRIAEISKLMLNCGIITICACISPTEKIRKMAYDIIGRKDVIEVFINTPLQICETRDTKGLYAKARAGDIQNFTGINAPFEQPVSANLVVDTTLESPEESVSRILTQILPEITF